MSDGQSLIGVCHNLGPVLGNITKKLLHYCILNITNCCIFIELKCKFIKLLLHYFPTPHQEAGELSSRTVAWLTHRHYVQRFSSNKCKPLYRCHTTYNAENFVHFYESVVLLHHICVLCYTGQPTPKQTALKYNV